MGSLPAIVAVPAKTEAIFFLTTAELLYSSRIIIIQDTSFEAETGCGAHFDIELEAAGKPGIIVVTC